MKTSYLSLIINLLVAASIITSAAIVDDAVAMQVADGLTPTERVKVVEKAIQKSGADESKPAVRSFTVKGRFVKPDGGDFEKAGAGLIARSKTSSMTAQLQVNDDGTFEKSIRGPAAFYVYPQIDGFSRRCFGPFGLSEEDLDLGDLKLDVGFDSQILVQNEAGEPISDVKIESVTKWLSVRGRLMGHAVSQLVGATSNAEGIIKLRNMSDEPITVALSKAGYEHDDRKITLEKDGTLDWKLLSAEPLNGQFVDKDGNPITGVEVHLARREGNQPRTVDPRIDFLRHVDGGTRYLKPIAVSDEKGQFEIDSLRRDSRYWLMTLHRDHRPKIIPKVSAGDMLNEVTLEGPLLIRGKVTGDLTKLPVRSQRRYLNYRNPMSAGDFSYDGGFECDVDDQGRFEISQLLPGKVNLSAGGQTLRLQIVDESLDGLVFDLNKPQPPPNKNFRPLQIVLNPTADQPIRGEVQLSWRLSKRPAAGPSSANEVFPAAATIQWEAPPGADVFFYGQKLVGSYAANQSLGVVPEGSDPHQFSIDIDPAGLASGQVVDADGSPIRIYRIDVDRYTAHVHAFQVHAVRIDHREGRFALGPLPLGDEHQYRTFVQVNNTWRLAVSEPFQVNKETPVHTQTIQLPPAIHLSGRVLNAYGEPAAGVQLAMSWNALRTSRSVGSQISADREGRFRVAISSADLEGEYSFSIKPHGNSVGRTFVFRSDEFAGDHDFGDIRLQLGSTLRGFVVDADGNPQKNVTINLTPMDRENADYRDGRSDRSDDDGVFEIEGVERIPQRLYLFGKELVDATSPFRIEQDERGNQRWIVEPFESSSDVTIIVK